MSTTHHIEGGTILGTVTGTALTVAVNIGSSDVVKTVILASVGAVVSFSMSVFLKWCIRRIKRMINADGGKTDNI